jgi:DNA-binding transcriptional regulator YiaG
MSRGVFASLLHTSSRTLENWEQGRSAPNESERLYFLEYKTVAKIS